MKKVLLGLALIMPIQSHAAITLTSPDFQEGSTLASTQVFNGFGCTGDNKAPTLHWSGVPAEAKSLALTMYDPDAPTGSGWWHWLVFNLPPTLTSLPEPLPEGSVQSVTDFGTTGYGGPCPPVGDKPHRYIFTLYALKESLPLDAKASGAMVGYYLNQLALEKVSLTGLYGR